MEIWKDIKDYENYYMASNLWRIKSIERVITQFWHKNNYKRVMNEKILNVNTTRNWYTLVHLCKEWIRKAVTVHKLVAETFLNKNDYKKYINHKDWNKLNNCVENLEWCTVSENIKHSYDKLKRKKSKFTKKIECIETKEIFFSIKEASQKTKISTVSISHCLNWKSKTAGRLTWREIK